MASEISVAQFVAEYGAHYDGNPENKNRLLSELRMKPRTAAAFSPYFAKGTLERMVIEGIDEVVQPGQVSFTPKSTHSFAPSVIELFDLKIDFKGSPDKFRKTFLRQLATPHSNPDRTQAPYVEVALRSLIEQSVTDRETKSYRYGRYDAPTEGTPGNAINAMNGLVYTFREAVKAGGKNFALTADPSTVAGALDAFEEAAQKIDSKFEGKKVIFWSDPVYVRNYLKDRRNTHGADTNYQSGVLTLDFYDIYGDGVGWEIRPIQALAGTGIIAASDYDNVVHATLEGQNPVFGIEGEDRNVKIFADWSEGFGVFRAEDIYLFDANWSVSASESGTVV